MTVLPPPKVSRHIPIILALFLLFTKELKEVHITEMCIFSDPPSRSFRTEISIKKKIKKGKEVKLKKSKGN